MEREVGVSASVLRLDNGQRTTGYGQKIKGENKEPKAEIKDIEYFRNGTRYPSKIKKG